MRNKGGGPLEDSAARPADKTGRQRDSDGL